MKIINTKKIKGVNLKLFVVSMAVLCWICAKNMHEYKLFARSSSMAMAIEEEEARVQTTLSRIPLIIGAGRGTTGTHLMIAATCHLGYPSMHWNSGCIPPDSNNDSIPKVYQTAVEKHISLATTVHNTAICILRDKDCAESPAVMFKAQILDQINDLVQYTSDFMNTTLALHDNPYPSLMPSMINAVKLHYNGTSPVILLSERNATEYTQRRIENHGLRDIMCKDSMNTSTSSSRAPSINQETLEGGAFDIIGCIDRAVSGLSVGDAQLVTLLDVFTTMGKVYAERGNSTTTIELIARNVKVYQDAVGEMAASSYDMFAKKERTKKESLAEIMESSVESMQYGQPIDYILHWDWPTMKIENGWWVNAQTRVDSKK